MRTPALAQQAKPTAEAQRALSDPATADRLANVMQALSQAFLDLPVGSVEAAVEGRPPTTADPHAHDPQREPEHRSRARRPDRPVAADDRRQGMKAMADALPGMMKGFKEAQKSFERALSNMPDPTYPKR